MIVQNLEMVSNLICGKMSSLTGGGVAGKFGSRSKTVLNTRKITIEMPSRIERISSSARSFFTTTGAKATPRQIT